MKKKKVEIKSKGSKVIFSNETIIISKENEEYFFEIGNQLTNDISEAVSILMYRIDWESPVWELEIEEVITENICPEKSLYWLTGGYEEWQSLEHYNKPWSEYYLDFQEEFGMLIVNIIKKSKKLKDIRNKFTRLLHISILYDFAISKGMVK